MVWPRLPLPANVLFTYELQRRPPPGITIPLVQINERLVTGLVSLGRNPRSFACSEEPLVFMNDVVGFFRHVARYHCCRSFCSRSGGWVFVELTSLL